MCKTLANQLESAELKREKSFATVLREKMQARLKSMPINPSDLNRMSFPLLAAMKQKAVEADATHAGQIDQQVLSVIHRVTFLFAARLTEYAAT